MIRVNRRGAWAGAAGYAAVALVAVAPALAQDPPTTKPSTQSRAAKRQAAPKPPAVPPAAPAAETAAQPVAPQGSAGPPPIVVAVTPSQSEWTKVCGKHPAGTELCYTTRDFSSDKGQPVLAVAFYDIKAAGAPKLVRVVTPLGMLVPAGIRVAVDQGPGTPGRFGMCLQQGCFAEAQVDDAFVDHLKSGTNVNVSVRNQTGREVTLAAPLEGFAKAFDGPAIDPQVLQEQQRKVAEEVQRWREELQKRLAGNAAPSSADPAAPAPDVAAAAAPHHAEPVVTAGTPSPPAGANPEPAAPAEPHRQVTASSLADKGLIGTNGAALGEIERVVEHKKENKRYVIVSRGGVLGFFEEEYAVPVERLALRNDQVVARDVTEQQLSAMTFTDGNSYRTLEGNQAIDIAEQK